MYVPQYALVDKKEKYRSAIVPPVLPCPHPADMLIVEWQVVVFAGVFSAKVTRVWC
jgi:hypothetical protein